MSVREPRRSAPGNSLKRAEVRRGDGHRRSPDGLALSIEVRGPRPSDGDRQSPRRLAEILV